MSAPIFIDGEWQQSDTPGGTFQSSNPNTGSTIDTVYPVSGYTELGRMVAAGRKAAVALRSIPPQAIAGFLDAYADAIEARTDEIVSMAHRETALSEDPRFRSAELPRTTDQLRQAATAARERSWCRATIDTQNNIRSMYEPLGGPVVIFGPNNFPLAFNAVSGGDFAAAIAAGNPVIAKGHPGHPGTTRLLTQAASEALRESDVPPALVQMFYHTEPADGLRLVAHAHVGAVAFTGSRASGLALKQAADEAGTPIYLEMSSINPVVVLPGALKERQDEVVADFVGSCTLGAGQFCTNPGLVLLLENEQTEMFLEQVAVRFEELPAGQLLSEAGPGQLADAVAKLQDHGAVLVTGGAPAEKGEGYRFQNTLLRVAGDTFLEKYKALQTEAFGSTSLFVVAREKTQLVEIVRRLEGNLTGTLYSHSAGDDDALYDIVAPVLRERVGRLLNDKMPTGVAVSPAMVHGGPYPATGHPGFTAVGIPRSLQRFAALRCYDNVRLQRLPVELQDTNPTGRMWRFVDGEWTQRALSTT